MKKTIITAIIIVLIIIGAIVIVNITNNSKEKVGTEQGPILVKVNEVTRSVFYSPQYAAIALGYFADYGIEVELTTGQGADNVMTAVLSGQSDIGFAGPEAAIYVYNEGKEDYPQVFAQLTKRDGSFLVAREKTDNFSWEDLKGKTVIPGRKGGVPRMTLEYVLKQNGIDISKDLVLDDSISFDLMAGSFAGGNADYVTLFEPTASLTESNGIGYIVASVGKEAGEIPYTAYFALQSYITKNEELIQNFTNAIYKGQQWVKEHSAEEIAEQIVGFFPDTDVETLATSIQKYKDIDAWNETPVLTKEAFEKLQDVIEEAGELDKRADYDKVVNNKYAEEAIK
ncbi:MAG: ABC transporter substrate-binding protein [Clostridia bacterium]